MSLLGLKLVIYLSYYCMVFIKRVYNPFLELVLTRKPDYHLQIVNKL